ncbi:GGDEF domain-containing protein [Demequina globuliformis]|uniref:GGDEF domain-containing protein n=1 Tax=Demequina globuliformis TaxID=676202 RepID=UPI0007804F90|nr:GGDEF domain-containing protein [Demequina globuliformis]
MTAEGPGSRRRGALSDTVARLLERGVSGLTGEVGRAAASTQAFLGLCLVITLGYLSFYLSYDAAGLRPLVLMHVVWIALHTAGIVIVRCGRQLAAALTAFAVPTVQMAYGTWFLGWESGVHLYLLAAAQLVYVLLTKSQWAWRAMWVVLSLGAFLLCQFTMPASRAQYEMPRTVLNGMFSVAAVVTAALLFMLAAIAHYRADAAQQLAAESAHRAESLANTDALTGLATRRPVLARLEALALPGAAPYCVAIADLDRFKELNDAHGHACGDAVLAEVGVRLRAELRLTDSVGRWGGEEFIFVLPDATLEEAALTMDRIRRSIGERPVVCSGHDHAITVSIGVTEGEHVGSAHYAIKRADDALYTSKQKGRDRVSAVQRDPAEGARLDRVQDRRRVRGAGA